MLTDRQRARCREIAAALDRHDQGPWLKAEPSLSVEAKGLIWDQRAHVIAEGGRGKTKPLNQESGSRVSKRDAGITSAGVADLDYWSDTDDPPDDDDDELTLKTKVCDSCRGLGLTSDGTRCTRCNGSGRVDRDDVDDGDDDEDRRREDTDDDEEN